MVRLKKISFILVAFVLILGSFSMAFAQGENASISKDKAKEIAVKIVKECFNADVTDKKFETGIRYAEENYRGKSVWRMSWSMYEGEKNLDIDVEVDAKNGRIIGMDKYEYDHNDTPRIAKITQEEAKKITQDFLQKMNPQEMKEVKLEESNDPYRRNDGTEYYFRYSRIANGVEFNDNGINITVDGVTGQVTNYGFDWEEEGIPSKDGIIEKEKAQELLNNAVEMELSYSGGWDYNIDEEKDIKLVYRPDYSRESMVDAKKGVLVDYRGKEKKEENVKTKDITKEEKEKIKNGGNKPLKSNIEISKEEATKVMTTYLKEFFQGEFEIESIRYTEENDRWLTKGRKAWEARFNKKDSSLRYGPEGRIIIDACTKELISIDNYNFEENEEFDPKITWEEGYDKAIDIIKNYYPSKIMDIDTKEEYEENYYYENGKKIKERTYYYQFPRMVDGVYYDDNSIHIAFDAKTGEIESIECSWDEEKNFPSKEKAMSKEKAKEIYMKLHETELAYTLIEEEKENEKMDRKISLVYELKPIEEIDFMSSIDALSGKPLDFQGNEVKEIKEGSEDLSNKIKGHWAEKELSILAAKGVVDSKTFDMNKEITKLEAVKMLVNARGFDTYRIEKEHDLKFKDISKDNENYKYIQMAVVYGIIENKDANFSENSKITREEMAKMLVELIGYEKVAKLQGIYTVPFKDANNISQENMGAVALCKGFGIIQGENGSFRPKDNATMLEMAISIYKALGNIK